MGSFHLGVLTNPAACVNLGEHRVWGEETRWWGGGGDAQRREEQGGWRLVGALVVEKGAKEVRKSECVRKGVVCVASISLPSSLLVAVTFSNPLSPFSTSDRIVSVAWNGTYAYPCSTVLTAMRPARSGATKEAGCLGGCRKRWK